mgnify:CR=1 FL=1
MNGKISLKIKRSLFSPQIEVSRFEGDETTDLASSLERKREGDGSP